MCPRFIALIGCRAIQLRPEAFMYSPLKLNTHLRSGNVRPPRGSETGATTGEGDDV